MTVSIFKDSSDFPKGKKYFVFMCRNSVFYQSKEQKGPQAHWILRLP